MNTEPKSAISKQKIPSKKSRKTECKENASIIISCDGAKQDFNKLRQQCLAKKTLFEDPEFSAEDSSLYFSQKPELKIEWKRPKDIADNPKFFVERLSRFDVQQGNLSDGWLLIALANLTMYPDLFFKVVPEDQSFQKNYAGIFHFRFWRFGQWVEVIVDDLLPTYQGKLLYLNSGAINEFWSALLEKAYAKFYGSYEALNGGRSSEAMEDFTGGVVEMFQMADSPPNLFQILLKAHERNSMIGCEIRGEGNVVETNTQQGLLKEHTYNLTRVKYIEITQSKIAEKIPLLRLRNLRGDTEWSGAWCDESTEWKCIPDAEKKALGLTFDLDGEFWMSFKDFKRYITALEICHLNPNCLADENLIHGKKKWEISAFKGEWVREVTAGGCENFLDTYWQNPQYRITLEHPDECDDLCTIIVALMQKNRREQKKIGIELLTIGFSIHYLENPDPLPKSQDIDFFKSNYAIESSDLIDVREVTCRFNLLPGSYCIVPSTFDPDEEGEFLLRVFSETKNNMEEMKAERVN